MTSSACAPMSCAILAPIRRGAAGRRGRVRGHNRHRWEWTWRARVRFGDHLSYIPPHSIRTHPRPHRPQLFKKPRPHRLLLKHAVLPLNPDARRLHQILRAEEACTGLRADHLLDHAHVAEAPEAEELVELDEGIGESGEVGVRVGDIGGGEDFVERLEAPLTGGLSEGFGKRGLLEPLTLARSEQADRKLVSALQILLEHGIVAQPAHDFDFAELIALRAARRGEARLEHFAVPLQALVAEAEEVEGEHGRRDLNLLDEQALNENDAPEEARGP